MSKANAELTCERVGIVVIGRNESRRLEVCLDALSPLGSDLVYVDSASTDGSPEIAERKGIRVLKIESPPYSAARGRQAGLDLLLRARPNLRYVQFVDGDCILDEGWVECAEAFLTTHPEAAAVAGRLCERRLSESLLIRLVNVDWDLPTGEIDALGGIFMARIEALHAVNGWRTDLVAGEELDLSARLRAAGWTLHRLPDQMALHDIGITRVRELWRRTVRTGFAYAGLAWLHGGTRCRRWLRVCAGNVVYGAVLPAVLGIGMAIWWPMSLGVLAVYVAAIARITAGRLRAGDEPSLAFLYALFIMATKPAQALGVAKFLLASLFGTRRQLIEYKRASEVRAIKHPSIDGVTQEDLP